jgi:peroxiredoxin
LGLDQEAAVKAGLLSRFESHHVTEYDGAALLNYWETDGKPESATIDDPVKGSAWYVFDPRCLGLSPTLMPATTIEDCLGHRNAESVQLVGSESVEKIATWHVRVLFKSHISSDFWIDVGPLSRVIKNTWNGDEVISRFDPAQPGDVIPTEVLWIEFSGMNRERSETRFVRRRARFNVPVDPASWTLAGLNMPVGTEVIDIRIHRRIGYWNGSGLSQNFVSKTAQPPSEKRRPPNTGRLLALAENDPKSSFALDAAIWIVLNTPDGPDVEKAADIVWREHIGSTNLVLLCEGLKELRHRSAMELLRSIIKDNPNANVRAHACFALATILKNQGNKAGDTQTVMEAAQMFERVVSESGRAADSDDVKLADDARSELFELRHLGIGRMAPEIEGVALDGQKMKLSDYRGKVVVLTFWGTWCSACMEMVPDERTLVERMSGKPFALVGVNSDDDLTKVKRSAEKEHITWPSFRDGNSGPIAKAWNVQSWPAVYVLDREGVIRYRGVRGKALNEAVEALVQAQSGSTHDTLSPAGP